jgi:2',3'-cyclic-nucleotide 2'-phosphodiesterase (5'-nucleotidase family)
VRTADFEYWRLRKPPYTASRVVKEIREREGAGDLFVYLKHEDSPENALVAAQVFADLKIGSGSAAPKTKPGGKTKR